MAHTNPAIRSHTNRNWYGGAADNPTLQYLRQLNKRRSLIAASRMRGSGRPVHGILQGHAYSVLRLKQIQGRRLVQFRNPWGSFEWKGDWSDSSVLWEQNPSIARELAHVHEDDGAFWMEWHAVLTHFDSIDVCVRIRGAALGWVAAGLVCSASSRLDYGRALQASRTWH